MIPPKDALVVSAGEPIDQDVKSWLPSVMKSSTEETGRFLSDLCHTVEYSDYPTLKVQDFIKLRALAMSDEFENISDDARRALLKTSQKLEVFRSYPEYTRMRQNLREALLAANESAEVDPRVWLEKFARKSARRQILRLIAAGPENRESTKLLAEILDRELPKMSRNAGEVKPMVFTPEAAKLLEEALAVVMGQKNVTPIEIGHFSVDEPDVSKANSRP